MSEDEQPIASLTEMRPDGDLAVLTYRRQRVLNDIRDPTRRSAFSTRETTTGRLPSAIDGAGRAVVADVGREEAAAGG